MRRINIGALIINMLLIDIVSQYNRLLFIQGFWWPK